MRLHRVNADLQSRRRGGMRAALSVGAKHVKLPRSRRQHIQAMWKLPPAGHGSRP